MEIRRHIYICTHRQQQSACLLFANIQKLIFICLLSLFASGKIVGRHRPPLLFPSLLVTISVSVLASSCGPYRIRHTHKSWPSVCNFFCSSLRSLSTFLLGPNLIHRGNSRAPVRKFFEKRFQMQILLKQGSRPVCVPRWRLKSIQFAANPAKVVIIFVLCFAKTHTHTYTHTHISFLLNIMRF